MQLLSPVPASLFACYAEGITTPRRTTEGLQQMAELLGCEQASLVMWDGALAWGCSHHASRQPDGWKLHLDDKALPAWPTRQLVANMVSGTWQIVEKSSRADKQASLRTPVSESLLCMRILSGKGAEAFLSLQKKDHNWHIAGKTLQLADALVKPLAAILDAMTTMRQLSQRTAQLSSVFDCIRMPLLVLDRSMRVLMANTAAQSLMSGASDSANAPGSFSVAGVASERLAQLIHRACGVAGNIAASALHVKPTGIQPPLQIVVLPIVSKGAQPVALVLVHGRADPQESAGLLLQHIYGLTPAEERLALMILQGESPGTAAARLQISLSTVRSQLSSVLQKTGAQRQADLVRRLSALLLVNQRLHKG